MNEPIRPTTAAAWRERSNVTVVLPSGMAATLRTPSLNLAVRLGYIPDSLTPLVAQMIADNQGKVEVSFKTMADIAQYVELLNALVASSFVSPVVVIGRAPDEATNEIALEDIPDGDIGFVASFINAPAGALARFRDEQARALESLDTNTSDRAGSEPLAETGPLGEGELSP